MDSDTLETPAKISAFVSPSILAKFEMLLFCRLFFFGAVFVLWWFCVGGWLFCFLASPLSSRRCLESGAGSIAKRFSIDILFLTRVRRRLKKEQKRRAFSSQSQQNTSFSDRFWKLGCGTAACLCGTKCAKCRRDTSAGLWGM